MSACQPRDAERGQEKAGRRVWGWRRLETVCLPDEAKKEETVGETHFACLNKYVRVSL